MVGVTVRLVPRHILVVLSDAEAAREAEYCFTVGEVAKVLGVDSFIVNFYITEGAGDVPQYLRAKVYTDAARHPRFNLRALDVERFARDVLEQRTSTARLPLAVAREWNAQMDAAHFRGDL